MTNSEIKTIKHNLRNDCINRRKSLNSQTIGDLSHIICHKAFESIDWLSINNAHFYQPIKKHREVDTATLLSLIPEFIEITFAGTTAAAKIPSQQFDVIIIPVLGFDDQNYRLGFGAGWYDRFLSHQQHATTIGLAYSSSLVSGLPHEVHDIPLDIIVTEKDIFQRSPNDA